MHHGNLGKAKEQACLLSKGCGVAIRGANQEGNGLDRGVICPFAHLCRKRLGGEVLPALIHCNNEATLSRI